MTNKKGGDANQANFGSQFDATGQDQKGVASAGPSIVDSLGGAAHLAQGAAQDVVQGLGQGNFGLAGSGGDDNVHADTNISI
jgi:crotonobetainyl-CoA:carnitine CoA-transferase CaiB-like acyl-CoA transferase